MREARELGHATYFTRLRARFKLLSHLQVELNEVIEDNIFDNEDIDIDYDVFIDEDVVDGNVQELGDVSSSKGDTRLHLSQFVSRTFHIFIK